ncbi:tetratricopeptide repeat protein [Calothrix sp. PCC 6303]|uniref:tetratricopeptide repeat protein n=1 Tax=Calothrix sp. PCC 6303 TaxID=1170562 RepID=UPI00030A9FEE|nr:tetratricopeptide repeat protein [Calothrix sp. PCC 6303]
MKFKQSFKLNISNKPLGYFTLGTLITVATSFYSLVVVPQAQARQLVAILSEQEKAERAQLIQTANSQMGEGKFAAAETSLRELLKKFPRDAFGYYQLGNVLARQNRSEDAIAQYQQALKYNPRYAVAYNAIGLTYGSLSQWDEAASQFRKALEINPNYGDAMYNLGQVLWQGNYREDAIASFEKALKIFKAEKRDEKVRRIEKTIEQLKKGDDPGIS